MARHARLKLADYPVHVIQRGHNRAACFFAEADYLVYLQILREQAERFDCAIHAYVLMTNHVHLLLTPAAADGTSWLMKHLGQRYVQYINRMRSRSGTLWEGRFRSSIVQSQHYLLACYRYIELNPVRAGMASHPADYRWSSFRTNAGSQTSSLLAAHAEYLALGRGPAERAKAYASMFEGSLEPLQIEEIRAAANAGLVLGTERFKTEAGARLARRVVPGIGGRPRKWSTPDCWS